MLEPVYLPPADARAAFEQGSVDAWVIWDPFLAAAQAATDARALADATGVVNNHQFYLSSQSFVATEPEIVQAIVEEIAGSISGPRPIPKSAASCRRAWASRHRVLQLALDRMVRRAAARHRCQPSSSRSPTPSTRSVFSPPRSR